jgi:hypothetical protein
MARPSLFVKSRQSLGGHVREVKKEGAHPAEGKPLRPASPLQRKTGASGAPDSSEGLEAIRAVKRSCRMSVRLAIARIVAQMRRGPSQCYACTTRSMSLSARRFAGRCRQWLLMLFRLTCQRGLQMHNCYSVLRVAPKADDAEFRSAFPRVRNLYSVLSSSSLSGVLRRSIILT